MFSFCTFDRFVLETEKNTFETKTKQKTNENKENSYNSYRITKRIAKNMQYKNCVHLSLPLSLSIFFIIIYFIDTNCSREEGREWEQERVRPKICSTTATIPSCESRQLNRNFRWNPNTTDHNDHHLISDEESSYDSN